MIVSALTRTAAHPHVCGEHSYNSAVAVYDHGSSPRMRGTQTRQNTRAISARLIPTYAGNTCTRFAVMRALTAHPHVCGEHAARAPYVQEDPGSSPRMRGTHIGTPQQRGATRLIPTYAGNTPAGVPGGGACQAHPHVCGEHVNPRADPRERAGSSPRMRGTPASAMPPMTASRLIPTYAGNTLERSRRTAPKPAHPHVCGEHRSIVGSLSMWNGSSPRMRGTHAHGHRIIFLRRLIPTYAGNTANQYYAQGT